MFLFHPEIMCETKADRFASGFGEANRQIAIVKEEVSLKDAKQLGKSGAPSSGYIFDLAKSNFRDAEFEFLVYPPDEFKKWLQGSLQSYTVVLTPLKGVLSSVA